MPATLPATSVPGQEPVQPSTASATQASAKQAPASAKQAASSAAKTARRGTKKTRSTDGASDAKDQGQADQDLEATAQALNATPEAVMEVKRRKAAFKIMMRLLEDGAPDAETMTRMCAPLSGDEFLQVAEERSLAGKCGNPLCDGSVQQRRAQGPRWQLAADTVAPETGALYCSAACNELVAQYAEALGDPMQRMNPAVKERLLVSHGPHGASKKPEEEVAAQVNGVTTMLANVQERAAAAPTQITPPSHLDSRAVEGYVPRSTPAIAQHAQRATPSMATQLPLPPSQQDSAHTTKPHPGPHTATTKAKSHDETTRARAGSAQVASQADTEAGARSVKGTQSSASGNRGGAVSVRDRMAAGVARHITALVDDVGAPGAHATGSGGSVRAQPGGSSTQHASATGRANIANVSDYTGTGEGSLRVVRERVVRGGRSPSPPVRASRAADAVASDSDASTSSTSATSSTDDSDSDSDAYSYASSARGPSTWHRFAAAPRPILKHTTRQSSGGRADASTSAAPVAKKHVRWADDECQEFTDREGAQPETPVLVFTLDAAGNVVVGGGEGGDRPRLAGRLEVQDASKLGVVPAALLPSSHPTQTHTTATEHISRTTGDGTSAQSELGMDIAAGAQQADRGIGVGTGDTASGARPAIPKALTLLFPPSAGGVGVPVARAEPPGKSSNGSGGCNERRFRPRVPAGPRVSQADTQQADAQPARAPAAHTAGSQRLGPVPAAPAGATPGVPAQGPQGVVGATQSAQVQRGAAGPQRGAAAPRTLGRDPARCKVVMLDAAPPRRPAGAPSTVTRTYRADQQPPASTAAAAATAAAGNTRQPAAQVTAARVSAAMPHVVPQPEVLPFEELDPTPTTAATNASNGKNVRVIKSEGRHAQLARGNQATPSLPELHTSDEDTNTDEELYGDEDTHTHTAAHKSAPRRQQPRPKAHRAGKARRHSGSSDSDGSHSDSDASADTVDSDEVSGSEDDRGAPDSSSGHVAGSNGQQPASVRRGRAVRGDVIREEDDESAEHALAALAADADPAARDAAGAAAAADGNNKVSCSEDDDSDVDADYNAAVPFFGPPPKGYRVELSPFNLLWTLLSGWVSQETLAYMNAAASTPAKNGAETAAERADSAAADRVLVALPAPSAQSAQAQAALAQLLLPHVVHAAEGMQARVATGEVAKRVTGLIRTLLFTSALPSLSAGQWRLLGVAVLRALSMKRLPSVVEAFEGADGPPRLAALLSETGFELPHLSGLVDLLLNP